MTKNAVNWANANPGKLPEENMIHVAIRLLERCAVKTLIMTTEVKSGVVNEFHRLPYHHLLTKHAGRSYRTLSMEKFSAHTALWRGC